jgi:hypothetical protein
MTEPGAAAPAVEGAPGDAGGARASGGAAVTFEGTAAAGGTEVAAEGTAPRKRADEAAARSGAKPARPWPAGGTGFLLVLGLAWLGARLWSARANIRGAGDGLSRLIVAAYQLPDVLAAGTLAGGACGVAAVAWRTARRPAGRWRARWLAGALAGLLAGVLAGTMVLLGYGSRSPDIALSAAVTVACLTGGAVAALAPARIMAAGVAAALGASILGVALNLFSGHIVDLFGPGTTAASRLAAANRAALAESLLCGVIGGLVAFAHLRHGTHERRFLGYLAAGATPGILALLGEAVTRVGGAQLLDLAQRISPADETAVGYFGSARLNHALVVLFAATLVALVGFGRTLPAKSRRPIR